MKAEMFEADESETAERTPAACPFCGFEGAFDGQGRRQESVTVTDRNGEAHFDTMWSQMRCSECNGRFRMLDTAVEASSK